MKARGIDRLNLAYGFYTAGFVVFALFMAVLEKMGLGGGTVAILFVVFTMASYAVIGWMARTMRVDAFYVAKRTVPAAYNGLAGGANWISGAAFVTLAGGIYFAGHAHLAFAIGWTGGLVLIGVLLAPAMRKMGCHTVPHFIAARYGSGLARLCALMVLLVVCFTLLTAHVALAAIILARVLPLAVADAAWLAVAVVLPCILLGGMRALTWTQVAQGIVLLVALLVTVWWLSHALGFGLMPHLGYGGALERIAALEALHGLAPAAAAAPLKAPGLEALAGAHHAPGGAFASWRFLALAACMMAGTAALPHVLMRCFTAPSVRAARKSLSWTLVIAVLVCASAPLLAVLVKLQLLDPALPGAIAGRPLAEVAALGWVRAWSEAGMMAVIDANGDGVVQLAEIFMRPDIVMLAAPEMAGLPRMVSGLLAAGALAAVLAAAGGLMLAMANALSHDLYHGLAYPEADTRTRLIVARLALVAIAAAAALAAAAPPAGILEMVAWALCLAASGLFFPLVLGVWWKRANGPGAIAGMAAGLLAGAAYLYHLHHGGGEWLGLDQLRFGVVGMAASLLAQLAVTLATPAPDAAARALLDELRVPSGKAVLDPP